jgi:hypothetical protein
MLPPLGVNFTALVRRFHTTCCKRLASPEMALALASNDADSSMFLAVAAGRTDSNGGINDLHQLDFAHVQAQLAGNDARNIEQIVDELHLRTAHCARLCRERLSHALIESPMRSKLDQPKIASAVCAIHAKRWREIRL